MASTTPEDFDPNVAVKYDSAKYRPDLLPRLAKACATMVMTYGEAKYPRADPEGPPNYLSGGGMPDRQYDSASTRHWESHMLGDYFDTDTGLPHLAHAVANAMMALETFAAQYCEEQDIEPCEFVAEMERQMQRAIADWKSKQAEPEAPDATAEATEIEDDAHCQIYPPIATLESSIRPVHRDRMNSPTQQKLMIDGKYVRARKIHAGEELRAGDVEETAFSCYTVLEATGKYPQAAHHLGQFWRPLEVLKDGDWTKVSRPPEAR